MAEGLSYLNDTERRPLSVPSDLEQHEQLAVVTAIETAHSASEKLVGRAKKVGRQSLDITGTPMLEGRKFTLPEYTVDWLERLFGEDWQSTLGIEDEVPRLNHIADRVLAVLPPKSPKHRDLLAKRVALFLRGAPHDIIAENTDASTSAVYQYLHVTLPNRAAKLGESPEIEESVVDVVEEIQEPEYEESTEDFRSRITRNMTAALELNIFEERALAEFLEANRKRELTVGERRVIDRVRSHIRGDVDDQENDLTPTGRQLLRRVFGVYTVQGQPRDREPVLLQHMIGNQRFKYEHNKLDHEREL